MRKLDNIFDGTDTIYKSNPISVLLAGGSSRAMLASARSLVSVCELDVLDHLAELGIMHDCCVRRYIEIFGQIRRTEVEY